MMDVSEIWRFLKYLVPTILLLASFRLCKRLRSKSIRIPARVATCAASIIACFILMIYLLGQAACTIHPQKIYSPDGKHVAVIVVFQQGALGADFVNVSVRCSWSPFSTLAFQGEGGWDSKHHVLSPEVVWIDNSHPKN
jgi:hypothetical protein